MDASNYRRVPLGVVAPRDADDVAAALEICRVHGVPVVARGGGTSIAGQATGTGVVLDFTRHMNTLIDLDPGTRTAVVQPGLVLDTLRDAAAPHRLTFGPDPSTHARCTLGGMIGNNSCGAHSVAWGTTADNVRELSVLTYSGTPHRLTRSPAGPRPAAPGHPAPPRPGAPDDHPYGAGTPHDPYGPHASGPAGRPGPGGPAGGLSGAPRRGALPDPLSGPPGLRELIHGSLALLRTGYPPGLPRRISGYALDALLPENGTDLTRAYCGSEGTLAVLTEAVVDLVPAPRVRALAVLGHPDETAAADTAALLPPLGPLTVEGMAEDLVRPAARAGLPRGRAWLFAETGGDTTAEARARAEALVRAAAPLDSAVVTDPAAMRALWRLREDAAGTATRMPDGSEAWPGWEDCAVPPARLGAYLRDFRALLAEHGLRGTPYGHFGEGCVHVRIDFDLLSAPGVRAFRRFSGELADLVVSHGGSLSGEHGDGRARAELLPKMYGPELITLFGRFKDLWDPDGGLNPGTLVRPAPLDEGLRFEVLPAEPVGTVFRYPHDGGDFAGAVRRCVGVAKCRDTAPDAPGVMCPSYRVTREEAHSTRGRARLLHEMLAGEVVRDGWRSPEVRDALDLCLGCKGCLSDCPVGVDMATYKAEFLHHHYAGRFRPASHLTLGRLPAWLRAAAPAAPLLNALASVPPLAAAARWAAGITPERPLPPLAPVTFRRWARDRPPGAGKPVLLWPDTFTEHLAPEVGRAAVRVLSSAGLAPLIPRGAVCCGLTYLSTGQLDRARKVLRRTLDLVDPLLTPSAPASTAPTASSAPTAPSASSGPGTPSPGPSPSTGPLPADRSGPGPDSGDTAVPRDPGPGTGSPADTTAPGPGPAEAGPTAALPAALPVVVLEPSCAAALRADLPELLPDDPRALRLAAAVRTFAEVLEEYAPDWRPPFLDRPAAGQLHCHQHAVLGDAADRRLRERAGVHGALTAGCCGLAGNFGFEKGHYDLSVACAEDRLLPALRSAAPETAFLADGYSCRTQIDQLGDGIRARHLAELLAEALDQDAGDR
jgi:FAD/FMN-containing dehydrogenase/Fe-S oxidoreductase